MNCYHTGRLHGHEIVGNSVRLVHIVGSLFGVVYVDKHIHSNMATLSLNVGASNWGGGRKRSGRDVDGGKKIKRRRKASAKSRGGESGNTEVEVTERAELRKLRALLVQKDRTIKSMGVELAKLKALGHVQSGHERWVKKTMKHCDVATRSKVFSIASTYFKVMKFLPRGYERFDDTDPLSMCQQVMNQLSGRTCDMPDEPFYQYVVVPCLAARWGYHRSYAVDRMTKVVRGKWC